MKLPNFFEFEPLNSAKAEMGIPRHVYGNLIISVNPSRLTELELEKIASPNGLDISPNDLTILPDGTLAYKNSRVLLYIRDITNYGNNKMQQPRFHLANCSTLKQMKNKNKFDKYVVSTNTSGNFEINIISYGAVKKQIHKLLVCQNCLDKLGLNGFSKWLTQDIKLDIVKRFSIDNFFKKYPKSLHSDLPKYNSDNAPINNYTSDFQKISFTLRESMGWRCQKCNIILSHSEDRKWLHVHHKNGLKNDNHKHNLEVLCIGCHAEEPNHGHLKNNPEYSKFLASKNWYLPY